MDPFTKKGVEISNSDFFNSNYITWTLKSKQKSVAKMNGIVFLIQNFDLHAPAPVTTIH